MPEVTCPRCGTRQQVAPDAPGYTCASCGEEWAFATCANCAVRFHMRPGTTDWICPECGHENGEPRMGEFPPEDDEESAEAGAGRHRPAGARATTARAKGPMTRGQLALIAVVGIAAVLVVAFVLSSLGGDGGTQASSAAPPSTSTQALCLHLRDLQTPREDAFTRLAATLQADASTIEAEGNADLAADVLKMRQAVVAYRDALAAQEDVSKAANQVAKAYQAMPC